MTEPRLPLNDLTPEAYINTPLQILDSDYTTVTRTIPVDLDGAGHLTIYAHSDAPAPTWEFDEGIEQSLEDAQRLPTLLQDFANKWETITTTIPHYQTRTFTFPLVGTVNPHTNKPANAKLHSLLLARGRIGITLTTPIPGKDPQSATFMATPQTLRALACRLLEVADECEEASRGGSWVRYVMSPDAPRSVVEESACLGWREARKTSNPGHCK